MEENTQNQDFEPASYEDLIDSFSDDQLAAIDGTHTEDTVADNDSEETPSEEADPVLDTPLDSEEDADDDEEKTDDAELEEDETEDESEESEDDLDESEEEDITDWVDIDTSQQIRLKDGTLTTLRDLTEGGMLESDYTKGKHQNREDAKSLKDERTTVGKMAEQYGTILNNATTELDAAEQAAKEAYQNAPYNTQQRQNAYDHLQRVQTDKGLAMERIDAERTANDKVLSNAKVARVDALESWATENITEWGVDLSTAIYDHHNEQGASDQAINDLLTGDNGKFALDIMNKAMLYDNIQSKIDKKSGSLRMKDKNISLKSSKGSVKPASKAGRKKTADDKARQVLMNEAEANGDLATFASLLDFE